MAENIRKRISRLELKQGFSIMGINGFDYESICADGKEFNMPHIRIFGIDISGEFETDSVNVFTDNKTGMSVEIRKNESSDEFIAVNVTPDGNMEITEFSPTSGYHKVINIA